jgi:glycosyltransferase involved in cell wall biosynthesis
VPFKAIADTPPFMRPGLRQPVISSAGRFVEGKNVEVLVSALINILRQSSASALLLGDGPLRGLAQLRLGDAGLAARCCCQGWFHPCGVISERRQCSFH